MGALSQIGWAGWLVVALGAILGAWLRLALSVTLNTLTPDLPLGTLVANVAGGLMIGAALAWISRHPELSPLWRLAFVTGFLGALTTFSTFSAESLALVQRGEITAALWHSAVHLAGSLLAAALGWKLASAAA